MSGFVENEVFLMCACIILGAELDLIYDVIRYIRIVFKHKQLVMYIEDIIFFIFSAFYTYFKLYNLCYELIRFFQFFFIALGAISFELVIGGMLLRLLKIIDKRFKIRTTKIIRAISDRIRKRKEVENHYE